MSETSNGENDRAARPSWWRRWVVSPLLVQLKQGTSPSKLAWTVAAGMTLGIFPIPGTRGWLCLLAGIGFRLNQPLLHTFKGLAFPLHLSLIIPFIQAGQWMFGKPPLSLSSEGLDSMMGAGTWSFIRQSTEMLLRAAVAWIALAPLVLFVTYAATAPLMRFLSKRVSKGRAVSGMSAPSRT